jgi:hypothetical protein
MKRLERTDRPADTKLSVQLWWYDVSMELERAYLRVFVVHTCTPDIWSRSLGPRTRVKDLLL